MAIHSGQMAWLLGMGAIIAVVGLAAPAAGGDDCDLRDIAPLRGKPLPEAGPLASAEETTAAARAAGARKLGVAPHAIMIRRLDETTLPYSGTRLVTADVAAETRPGWIEASVVWLVGGSQEVDYEQLVRVEGTFQQARLGKLSEELWEWLDLSRPNSKLPIPIVVYLAVPDTATLTPARDGALSDADPSARYRGLMLKHVAPVVRAIRAIGAPTDGWRPGQVLLFAQASPSEVCRIARLTGVDAIVLSQ